MVLLMQPLAFAPGGRANETAAAQAAAIIHFIDMPPVLSDLENYAMPTSSVSPIPLELAKAPRRSTRLRDGDAAACHGPQADFTSASNLSFQERASGAT